MFGRSVAADLILRLGRCGLLGAAVLALGVSAAHADFLLASDGDYTATGPSSISRYSDNGTLAWTTTAGSYASTANYIYRAIMAPDNSTVIAAVSASNGTDGGLLFLNPGTGAVTRTITNTQLGFSNAHPVNIAAAADGTYWLDENTGSGYKSYLVHLDANFNVLGSTQQVGAWGYGLTVDGSGNPILTCCSNSAASVYKFDKNNVASAPVLTDLAVGTTNGVHTGAGRGATWYNNALYVAVGSSDVKAQDDCYYDAVAKLTEDSNGALQEQTPYIKVCTTSINYLSINGLDFDSSGNAWLSNYKAKTVVKYAPDGTPTTVLSGLTNPTALDYFDVPEPGSMALIGLGVAGLIASRRRAKR